MSRKVRGGARVARGDFGACARGWRVSFDHTLKKVGTMTLADGAAGGYDYAAARARMVRADSGESEGWKGIAFSSFYWAY